MLYAINTKDYSKPKKWCGPSAVATIAGCSLKQATELACRVTGKTYEELEGMWPEDVILCLHELGFKCRPIDIQKRYPHLTHGPHLKTFMADRTWEEECVPVLVVLPEHFVSCHWGWLNDNWTLTPKPLDKFPMTGRKVKRAYTVMRG